MSQLAKLLIGAGFALAGVGCLLLLAHHLGLGRLPGDLRIEGERTTVYLPLASSLIISLALTLLVNWWLRSR